MSETAVNITVDPATVNKIVTTQLQAAVAASLGAHGQQFIEALVQNACSQKVDTDGKPSRGYNDGMPFIEWASKAALREAVNEVVKQWVTENKDRIRVALEKKLRADKNDLIKAMATGCAAAMLNNWQWEFNVNMSKG